jgi:hypothetical protein
MIVVILPRFLPRFCVSLLRRHEEIALYLQPFRHVAPKSQQLETCVGSKRHIVEIPIEKWMRGATSRRIAG